MKKITFKILIVLSFLLLIVPNVFAEDMVIINSEEWQDVYNGVVYANSKELPVKFLINYDQGIELLDLLNKENKEVLLIESNKNKIVSSYASRLEDKGFNVNILSGDNTKINIELLKKLNVNKVILMDDSFGHNAIAVGAYAVKSESFTLFVDKKNINSIYSEIKDKSITLFGKLDREAKNILEPIAQEIINKGDKFSNNFEILKKHLSIANRGQIILANGNFIEQEILMGTDPVLLVGNSNVPDDVIEFIKEADIKVGIAVGTSIIGNAEIIKNEADLKIFVKFAQGRNQMQLPLDIFNIPSYDFLLNIGSVEFNKYDNKLNILFTNPGKNYLVFKGDYELYVDGKLLTRFGDNEGIFISENSELTQQYEDIDLSQYNNNEITLKANVLMGEDLKALEYLLKKDMVVDVVEFIDDSEIDIINLEFDESLKRFYVDVKNLKSQDAYVMVAINDLIVDDEKEQFVSEKIKISGMSTETIQIKAIMEPIDYPDNELISLRASYSSREKALTNVIEKQMPLKLRNNTTLYIVGGLVALAIIFVLIMLFIFGKKKSKKSKDK